MWTKVGIVLALAVAALGSPIDERIIGGVTAAPGDVAFMVSIRDRDNIHRCGGSIISDTRVLTAASCILAMPPGQHSIYSGSVDIDGGDQHRMSQMVIHPDYAVVNGTPVNDIAVVHSQSAFGFDQFTGRAFLPPQGTQVPGGTVCTVAGWGSTSFGGGGSNVLLMVDLPVVDWVECAVLYSHLFTLPDNVVCAGGLPEGGADACERDDGGPLFERGIVVGVYTYGGLCGVPNRPGIYTQVSAYSDWINAN